MEQQKKILLVEPAEKTYKSLRTVLKCFRIDTIQTDLGSIRETLKKHDSFLKPVLACSTGSWKYLRWVNIWEEIMKDCLHDVPPFMKEIFNQHMVIPATVPPNQDIFDIIASKRFTPGNILYWIISNAQTCQNSEILVKTARKKIAADERHKISSKIPDPHDHHDFLSALRLIHGAVLFETIGEAKGKECYQRVCDGIGDLPAINFFSSTQEENLEPPTPISSVLLIDDKRYWYSVLQPILESLRIKTLHNPGNSLQSILAVDSKIPIRAIILDLKFPRGNWHGVSLLSDLDQRKKAGNSCKWLKKRLPIILLSVEDTFTKGAFLKKNGAFAYISKNPDELELGNRDELISFMQLKDLIIFAHFASLSDDLQDWLKKIIELDKRILSDANFRNYADNAFDTLYEGCHRIFHGKWQDYNFPIFLGIQQVIRAFGKLNDKWCELCTNNPGLKMNPDAAGDWTGPWKNKRWPHQAYHYILTNIRNTASHAMVEDEKFHFLDAWISILTFMLKLDGIHASGENIDRTAIDDVINKIIHSLSHLLFLIKVIPDDDNLYRKFRDVLDSSVQGKNFVKVREEITQQIQLTYEEWIRNRKGKRNADKKENEEYRKEYEAYGERVFDLNIRDSSLIIGMDPYFLRFRENAKRCFEYEDEDKYDKRTSTQKYCDLFLLLLTLCRLDKA
jgi:CheY-like chemotaxis protein